LIRDGVPRLDLLNGAPSNVTGGQPRHRIDVRALIYKTGVGAVVSGTWRSATAVGTGDSLAPDTLSFSALGTVDLRMFADLGRLPAAHDQRWAEGTRVSLVIFEYARPAPERSRFHGHHAGRILARLSGSAWAYRVVYGSEGVLASGLHHGQRRNQSGI
jgi:hypothetical protein